MQVLLCFIMPMVHTLPYINVSNLDSSSYVPQDPVAKDTLISEIEMTSNRLSEFFKSLDVQVNTTYISRVEGQEVLRRSRGRWRLCGDFRAIESENTLDGAKSILAYNSEYAFFMGRPRGEPKDQLFSYEASTSDGSRIVEEITLSIRNRLKVAQELVTFPLLDALHGEHNFTLIDIEGASEGDTHLVKVSFLRIDSDGGDYPSWALLDPSHHWAIVNAEVEWPWGTETLEVEYNTDIVHVPFPKYVIRRMSSPDYNVHEYRKVTFSTPDKCYAEEHEFTLTAYGLPEVRERNPWLRAAFSLTVLLVLAICILYAVRRR